MIKFYIIPDYTNANQSLFEDAMKAALGTQNIYVRMTIDGSDKGLLEFDSENLPVGAPAEGFTLEEIREELDVLPWTEEPSEGGEE